MKKDVQGLILVVLGVVVLRLTLSGQYLFYVAEPLQRWLLASSIIVLGLGGYAIIGSWRSDGTGESLSDEHGHDHGPGAPKVAYLLVMPFLAVSLVAPAALGSYSAGRVDASSIAPAQDTGMTALPPGDPVSLPLRDYVTRAVWDAGTTLKDRRITLTGFVTPDPAGGWWLTRMRISCCAADAQPSRVKVGGAPGVPADTWMQVTGRWIEGGGLDDPRAVPVIAAEETVEIPQPRDPYE